MISSKWLIDPCSCFRWKEHSKGQQPSPYSAADSGGGTPPWIKTRGRMFALMWANGETRAGREHAPLLSHHGPHVPASLRRGRFEYSFCVCRLKLKNYLENRKGVSPRPPFSGHVVILLHTGRRRNSLKSCGCAVASWWSWRGLSE